MNKLILGAGFLIVLAALLVGAWFVAPPLLYEISFFKKWIYSQLDEQSGGTFQSSSIAGDAHLARLKEIQLDMEKTPSNVRSATFSSLEATFDLMALLRFKLDLNEVRAQGGEVRMKLLGGDAEMIRFPVNAETFSWEQGRLVIEDFQGYELQMQSVQMKIDATVNGMKGSFTAAEGRIGSVELKNLKGEFEFSDGRLTVATFSSQLAGDSSLLLKGALAFTGEEISTRIESTQLQVETQDVRSLLTSLGYSEQCGGSAKVDLTVEGVFTPDRKALNGSGQADLESITVAVGLPSYPGFDQSGILEELKNITGLAGKAEFTLEGDQILVKALDLKNDRMELTGTMQIGYNRDLESRQTLLASPPMAGGIPAIAQSAFSKNENGWTVIPFALQGTTSAPRAEADPVISKVLLNPAGMIKGAGGAATGFLGGLFGSKKNEEEPPANQEEQEKTPPSP
ncbi:MAG: AsmA-like C-terminal region-containing protein [Candidatus Methylacidiphilales bacterium]